MLVRNNKKVSKIYRGEETIQRIYKGTDKVYDTVTKEFYTNQGTGEFLYELK